MEREVVNFGALAFSWHRFRLGESAKVMRPSRERSKAYRMSVGLVATYKRAAGFDMAIDTAFPKRILTKPCVRKPKYD